jgi:hypothetical protein
MTVHILLLRDQYDSDVVGVFLDPELGKETGDRMFPAMTRASWSPDGRGGQLRNIGVGAGAYLWLKPCEVGGAN